MSSGMLFKFCSPSSKFAWPTIRRKFCSDSVAALPSLASAVQAMSNKSVKLLSSNMMYCSQEAFIKGGESGTVFVGDAYPFSFVD